MPAVAPRFPRYLEAIVLAIAFAVAHTQSPLYYSNQNQYLLHGFAAGGHGHLDQDWLANTRDTTPVFSALVAAGYRHLGPWTIQAAFFLLLVGYFLSARWLVAALPGMPDTRAFRLAFAALFTAAHAAILRVASVEFTGVDYPWYLQCGVANQYILGPGLQPSAFGVLLVTALAAFANGRTLLAGALAGLACAFHATYTLPVALLTAGFAIAMVRQSAAHGQGAFKMVLAVSALVVPAAAYAVFTFASPNPHTFAEAQRILADVRIPHHTNINRWFAAPDAAQLAWLAVGLVLLRRTPLFLVTVIAAASGLVLSLVQYATGDRMLALLFPWRISAVLVPVATMVILANLTARLPSSRAVELAAGVVVLLLAAAGAWIVAAGIGYGTNEDERELLDHVRANAGPNDVYLLPIEFPELQSGRGTASTTFTPPPRPKPGSSLIPVDLQQFRLFTGVPIYVDFKSVPYFDAEVLEWHRRMTQCEKWYDGDWSEPGRAQELRDVGITHVVARVERPIKAAAFREVHRDGTYTVYEVR
jgi:uncharacterized protein DUF6798